MDLRGKKLGTILVDIGLLDADQVIAALEYSRQWGIQFGQACIKMGFIEEDLLVRALAVQAGAPSVKLAGIVVSDEVVELVPQKIAIKHRAIPISLLPSSGNSRKGTLVMAVSSPKHIGVADELTQITGQKLSFVITSDREIDDALLALYGFEVDAHTRATHMVDLEQHELAGSERLVHDPRELAMEFLPNLELDLPERQRR